MNCSLPCFHSMQRRLNGEKIQTTQEKPKDVRLTLKASHEASKASKLPLCDTLAKAPARNEKICNACIRHEGFNMF